MSSSYIDWKTITQNSRCDGTTTRQLTDCLITMNEVKNSRVLYIVHNRNMLDYTIRLFISLCGNQVDWRNIFNEVMMKNKSMIKFILEPSEESLIHRIRGYRVNLIMIDHATADHYWR